MKHVAHHFACFCLFANVGTTSAQTVTVDNFFNHELRKTSAGQAELFHYTWDDQQPSGYSTWGEIFRRHGARTTTLTEAPSTQNLAGTNIYILVDPDTEKETAQPHFIEPAHQRAIADWVRAGGVLVMLANDSANVELEHFNQLAQVFGIQFQHDNYHRVAGDHFDMGASTLPTGHPIFKTARKIYLKELATLRLSGTAKPQLVEGKHVIMATVSYGQGTVFAIGDPWLYNEYCNGRLPAGYDNDKAADDLAQWLLKQVRH